MVANYHRRLKDEWAGVIASNEYMTLNIRLRGAAVKAEAVIDRLDKESDGGITAVKLIASPQAAPEDPLSTPIELTIYHALVAAAYPQKRPVRIRYLRLYHNKEETVELTETQYRQNLEKMRARLQAWLGGEVLARPGPYCDLCPFQYRGCPIYPDESPEKPAEDLSGPSLPATLSPRNRYSQEAFDFEETDNPDP
jgi:RecB family exonuclease